MKKLLIVCWATLIGCTSTPSQKTSDMQAQTKILASESQGGTGKLEFSIIKNEQEFQKVLKGNSIVLVEAGKESEVQTPKFPKDKKVVLYNLGTFRSGDHRITEIKKISVKENVLQIEIPFVEHGGMEIQVISNPYVIFTVPSNYQFNSIEIKSSK